MAEEAEEAKAKAAAKADADNDRMNAEMQVSDGRGSGWCGLRRVLIKSGVWTADLLCAIVFSAFLTIDL